MIANIIQDSKFTIFTYFLHRVYLVKTYQVNCLDNSNGPVGQRGSPIVKIVLGNIFYT